MLLLMLALFIFGIGFGLLDVSMNVQAVAVEEGYGRPIMSTFHGVFIGGLLGAASAGLIAGAGVAPLPHLLAVALVLLVLVAVASRPLLEVRLPTTAYRYSRPAAGTPRSRCAQLLRALRRRCGGRLERGLLGERARFDPAIAAIGYAASSLAMAGMRLPGTP